MTRRRSVTEQAASAAIEQGCRMLRLPTIRDRFAEIASAAEREQMTYLGFPSELVIAECDDRARRRAERRIRDACFPRPKRLEEFLLCRQPGHQPRRHRAVGQLRLGHGRTLVVSDRTLAPAKHTWRRHSVTSPCAAASPP